MAVDFKRKPDKQLDGPGKEEELRARQELGIEGLADDEELIDHDSFHEMHVRLTRGRTNWGGEPEPDEIGEDDLILEEIATERSTTASGGGAPLGPPEGPGELVGLERELLVAKSRDQVVHLTLRMARHFVRAAALFVVQRDVLAGLEGSGEGLEQGVDGVLIPTGAESLFAEAARTAQVTRSWSPNAGIDQRILKGMGRSQATELAVFPVSIGERVVNLLYVDNGTDPLPETSIGALTVLCAGVGRVYQRMILKRKGASRP